MSDRTLLVKFAGKVDPSLESSAKRTETLAIGIGTMLGGLAAKGIEKAAEAAKDFFQGSLDEASKLNESLNVTTLVFGEHADAMSGFFEDAAISIGMSESAARAAGAGVGGLLANMGFARDETADWSQKLLTLSADMASAFDKDPEQAIRAIGAGLRGESEPLKQFNVFLNDAAVKSKAMEMGLYSGKGAIDQHAAAQARLAIIMGQTSQIQGDFANTSKEEANRARIVAAQYEDLQAQVGQKLLPLKEKLLMIVSEKIIPAFSQFADGLSVAGGWIQRNSDWLVPLGVGLGVVTAALFALDVQQKIVAAGGLVKWIATTITSTNAWAAAQWLLNVAMSANPIGIVITVLVALGAALVVAWNKSETFRKIVMGAWEGIKRASKPVVDWFVDTAWPALSKVIDWIAKGFEGLVGTLGRWGENIKRAMSGPIIWVWKHVLNPMLGGIEKVAGFFGLKLSLPRMTFPEARGFWGGGYTGPGHKHQPAGIVHAGEVVWSQEDVAAHGGPQRVDAWRRSRPALDMPGYAGGGIVANARQGFRGYNPSFLAAIRAWAAATGRMWYMTGNGGARSFQDQLRAWNLYQSGRGPLAANPWRGGPHMVPARAMDLHPRPGEVPSARALLGKFGLGLTVRGEPWHVGWLGGGSSRPVGGGFDLMKMVTDSIGTVMKVADAGGFGDVLNAIPGTLIRGAGDWVKRTLGFDAGGWLPPGATVAVNKTGRPEPVLTGDQWDVLRRATGPDLARLIERLAEAIERMGPSIGSVEITDAGELVVLEEFLRMARRKARAGV